MVGLTGQFVGIPFVQEGTFILSGYKGTALWFAPIPIHNYGGQIAEPSMTGTPCDLSVRSRARRGMAAAGLLGMFVGATLLALGYQVFMGWVARNPDAPRDLGTGCGS
jgi:xanthosine utilization system XapX-like protein